MTYINTVEMTVKLHPVPIQVGQCALGGDGIIGHVIMGAMRWTSRFRDPLHLPWEHVLKNWPSWLKLGPRRVGSYGTRLSPIGLKWVAWDSGNYFYFYFLFFLCSELGLGPSWTPPWQNQVASPSFFSLPGGQVSPKIRQPPDVPSTP